MTVKRSALQHPTLSERVPAGPVSRLPRRRIALCGSVLPLVPVLPVLILFTLAAAGCAGRSAAPPASGAAGIAGRQSLLHTVYQGPLNHLAGVRRGHCPMFPSCSEYSRQAIQKHGFWIGWIMSCDRLMRCARDELHLAPAIHVRGTVKCYDPVSENDRWWPKAAADRDTPGNAAPFPAGNTNDQ